MGELQGTDAAERALGEWLHRQRKGRSRLNDERKAQLESLPRWTWNVVESTWDDKLAALNDWLEAHDQVYPRRQSDDVEERILGRWVDNQRQGRARSTAERQESLEALHGWQWRASGTTCCFLRLESYTRCGADCHLRLAPNSLRCCKKHFTEVQGMPARRERIQNDVMVVVVVEAHPT